MHKFFAAALLIASVPSVALAQNADQPPAAAVDDAPSAPDGPASKRAVLDQREVPAPAGRSDSLSQGVEFSADVADDESSVSVQIGQAAIPGGKDGNDPLSTNWQVKLTVPIGGLNDLKPGSQIDLMSDGTKLTFSFSFLSFGGSAESFTSGRFQDEIWPVALEACEQEHRDDGESSKTAKEKCRFLSDGKRRRFPDPEFAEKYVSPNLIGRVLYGDIFRGGVEGAIGVDKMMYIDPVTLTKMEPNKTQVSGSAFFSWYPGGSSSVLNLRAEYQNGFEAQPEQAVCKPVVVNPAVDCVTGSLLPKHVERANLSVEYRQLFDVNWDLGTFAISPKATYDTLSNEFEAEFPLYFVPKNAGPFSPGVEMRYSSRTDEVTFGFFVRSTFKF